MAHIGIERAEELAADIEDLRKDRLEWLLLLAQSKNKAAIANEAIGKIDEQIARLSSELYDKI